MTQKITRKPTGRQPKIGQMTLQTGDGFLEGRYKPLSNMVKAAIDGICSN